MALGKKVVGSFQATVEVKRKAERKVIHKAVKKGKVHKYLIGEELGNVQDDLRSNDWEGDGGGGSSEEESNWLLQATEEATEEERVTTEVVGVDAWMTDDKLKKSKGKRTTITRTK